MNHTRARRLAVAAGVVVLVGVLSGCSVSVPGTAVPEPYHEHPVRTGDVVRQLPEEGQIWTA